MRSQEKSELFFTQNFKTLYIRKIELLMSEKKITWNVLAEKIGMSREGLYKSVKDNNLKVKTLIEIADFFSAPPTFFFEEKNDYDKPDVDKVMNILAEILTGMVKEKL